MAKRQSNELFVNWLKPRCVSEVKWRMNDSNERVVDLADDLEVVFDKLKTFKVSFLEVH